jgi:hypothetical protein
LPLLIFLCLLSASLLLFVLMFNFIATFFFTAWFLCWLLIDIAFLMPRCLFRDLCKHLVEGHWHSSIEGIEIGSLYFSWLVFCCHIPSILGTEGFNFKISFFRWIYYSLIGIFPIWRTTIFWWCFWFFKFFIFNMIMKSLKLFS